MSNKCEKQAIPDESFELHMSKNYLVFACDAHNTFCNKFKKSATYCAYRGDEKEVRLTGGLSQISS